MLNSIRQLFSPPIFPDDEEKTRAAELLNTVLIALTLLFFVALAALIWGGTGRYQIYIGVGVFTLVLVALQAPMRRGRVKLVGVLTIVIFTAVFTFALVNAGTVRVPGIALLTLSVIMSGLIIGRRAARWTAAINAIIFLAVLWLETNGWLPDPIEALSAQQAVIFTGNLILAAILLDLALRRINESLERARFGEEKLSTLNLELEQRVQERTAEMDESAKQIKRRVSQLEAIAHTARSAASAKSLEELLPAVATYISSQFGFYHVGIFLLDEGKEYAILKATNSAGGQNMLARGHRLKVGEQGIVGNATYSGTARVALDVGKDAVYFDNPDLPETHSEVALPLKFRDETIGALDIQSRETNAFSQEDVETFSILADQVSVAIQNARSLEQAQRALREAELATSQMTGIAWKGFAETIRTNGYRYDGIKPEPFRKTSKTDEEKDGFTAPVQLRGKTIGRLKLKTSDASKTWTEDEIAIIESTADRIALAMDGARLLDEAQKRAARETFLSELAARLGTSTQLDSILRDTVEELGQTLKGSTVTFQLVNPSALPTENKSE